MLLVIHNLPTNTRYGDIKSLIQSKCGLTDVILDNLVNDGSSKKVTVGLAEEGDAAILVRKINGLFWGGQQLYVEDVRQKKASEQPYRSSKNFLSLIEDAQTTNNGPQDNYRKNDNYQQHDNYSNNRDVAASNQNVSANQMYSNAQVYQDSMAMNMMAMNYIGGMGGMYYNYVPAMPTPVMPALAAQAPVRPQNNFMGHSVQTEKQTSINPAVTDYAASQLQQDKPRKVRHRERSNRTRFDDTQLHPSLGPDQRPAEQFSDNRASRWEDPTPIPRDTGPGAPSPRRSHHQPDSREPYRVQDEPNYGDYNQDTLENNYQGQDKGFQARRGDNQWNREDVYGQRNQDTYGQRDQGAYERNQDAYGQRNQNANGQRNQDAYEQRNQDAYGHRDQGAYESNKDTYGQRNQGAYKQRDQGAYERNQDAYGRSETLPSNSFNEPMVQGDRPNERQLSNSFGGRAAVDAGPQGRTLRWETNPDQRHHWEPNTFQPREGRSRPNAERTGRNAEPAIGNNWQPQQEKPIPFQRQMDRPPRIQRPVETRRQDPIAQASPQKRFPDRRDRDEPLAKRFAGPKPGDQKFQPGRGISTPQTGPGPRPGRDLFDRINQFRWTKDSPQQKSAPNAAKDWQRPTGRPAFNTQPQRGDFRKQPGKGAFQGPFESTFKSQPTRGAVMAPSRGAAKMLPGKGSVNPPFQRNAPQAGKEQNKTVKLVTLLQRDQTWRYQAAAEIAKEMLKNLDIIDMGPSDGIFTKLKSDIRSRIDVTLGDEISVPLTEIIERYRKTFPKKDDQNFFLAVLDHIKEDAIAKNVVAKQKHSDKQASVAKPAETPKQKPKPTPTQPAPKVPVTQPAPKVPVMQPAPKVPAMQPVLKVPVMQPVSADAKLPKYPNADKNVHKERKQVQRLEMKTEDPYELPPDLQKAVDEETDTLCDLFMAQCEVPDLPRDKAICERISDQVADVFRKTMRLTVTKRLLDIKSNLSMRIFPHGGKVSRECLEQFLKQYDVVALKKSDKSKMFIAAVNSYEGYDALYELGSAVVGGVKLSFTPLQVTGPPPKVPRTQIYQQRKKFIRSQIDNKKMPPGASQDFSAENFDEDDFGEEEESFNVEDGGNDELQVSTESAASFGVIDDVDAGTVKEDDLVDY